LLNYHFLKNDFLIFRGSERLDLINRLSTNQVNKLLQYQGIKTVLTTDKGRFIDLLTLYTFKDFIFVACSFGFGDLVKSHLDKYTIMDDFKCASMSGTHESMLLWGVDTEYFAKSILSFETTNYTNNDFKIINADGFDLIIARNDDNFGGFIIIFPTEAKQIIETKYLSKVSSEEFNLNKIEDDEFNSLRIEYGIPAIRNEMNENTNPLECGLDKYVSFTKGCYIGQEVIARLDTYDKISKHMVGIKLDNNVNVEQISDKSIIYSDNNECGFITSTTHSNKFGNIALGFVKTIFLDYNRIFSTRSETDSYKCKIIKLPFLRVNIGLNGM
jgi:folate-binding protein YgfZ